MADRLIIDKKRQIDGWMDGQVDEQMDRKISIRACIHKMMKIMNDNIAAPTDPESLLSSATNAHQRVAVEEFREET